MKHWLVGILYECVWGVMDELMRQVAVVDVAVNHCSLAAVSPVANGLNVVLMDAESPRSTTELVVVKSVTSNATQLLMTLLLGVIVMYIYAVVTFFYLQDTVYDYTVLHFDSDWIGEN